MLSHKAPTWWSQTFASDEPGAAGGDLESGALPRGPPPRMLLCDGRAIAAGQAASLQAIERAEEREADERRDPRRADIEINMRGRSRKNITDAPPVRGLFDIIDWETDTLASNPAVAIGGAAGALGDGRAGVGGSSGSGAAVGGSPSRARGDERLLSMHHSDGKGECSKVTVTFHANPS